MIDALSDYGHHLYSLLLGNMTRDQSCKLDVSEEGLLEFNKVFESNTFRNRNHLFKCLATNQNSLLLCI
jgi:hypothetical protein